MTAKPQKMFWPGLRERSRKPPKCRNGGEHDQDNVGSLDKHKRPEIKRSLVHQICRGASSSPGQKISGIELWHIPLTRSVRVLWTLFEIQAICPDVTFRLRRVELTDQPAEEGDAVQLYGANALAVNRNHTVPFLKCAVGKDEVSLFESGAIVSFLAEAFPVAGLAPAAHDLKHRAMFQKWLHYACTMADAVLWQVRLHHPVMGLLPSARRDPAIVAEYSEKFMVEVVKQVVDELSDGRTFILGESFSAADICLGYDFLWAKMFGIIQKHPLVVAYIRRLRSRPAWKLALADAHRFPSPQKHQSLAESYEITRRLSTELRAGDASRL